MAVIHPTFLDLPPQDPESCGVMVLPLPVDLTCSWERGTAAGPQAIIAASHHIELYDEEVSAVPSIAAGGIATAAEPELPTDPLAAFEAIAGLAGSLVRRERQLISLGGEHSVTAALVHAHRTVWPDLCVVQIDAHADMRDSYRGSRFNHACPMRRIMDEGVHVTGIGIRSLDESEKGYMLSDLSRIYPAHQVAGRLAEKTREIVGALPSRHVYLTVDLDGLDPSVVPAVGTPVPGGLGWHETLIFLRVLAGSREIIGADVVELSPRPGLHYADAAAARLIHKLIAYCWTR
jgi:agmatinase